jgi:phosphatidylinositol kinase/protein kinase (PI-3  family)
MLGTEQLLIPAMPGIGGGTSEVTVVGFGKSVHVFSSKQAPKNLTIFGSDFASHKW